MITRRSALAAAGVFAIAGRARGAMASGAFSKPLRMIVSAPAGTAPDLAIRGLRPQLDNLLGKPVVVENRSGANGLLAVDTLVRAEPDGHSFVVVPAGTIVTNPHLYNAASTRPLSDLRPVSTIATIDFMVAARSSLNVGSFEELLRRIRAEPDRYNVATTSPGSLPNLAAEMLRQQANLRFTVVPVTGGSQAGTTVAGGHADVVIETIAVLDPLIKAGLLKPLATTSERRGPLTPELPAVAELGLPDYAISGWIGVGAPSSTSPERCQALQAAIAGAMQDAEVRTRLASMNFALLGEDTATTARRWETERTRLGAVIRKAGIQLD